MKTTQQAIIKKFQVTNGKSLHPVLFSLRFHKNIWKWIVWCVVAELQQHSVSIWWNLCLFYTSPPSGILMMCNRWCEAQRKSAPKMLFLRQRKDSVIKMMFSHQLCSSRMCCYFNYSSIHFQKKCRMWNLMLTIGVSHWEWLCNRKSSDAAGRVDGLQKLW